MPGSPWVTYSVDGPPTRRVDIGPLRLWLRGGKGEVFIAHQRDISAGSGEDEPRIEARQWTRTILPASGSALRLRPELPDRAVVVEPESPFRLAPDAVIRIFARVPLGVRVERPEEPEHAVLELPTVVLARTWFGTFTEGELCYWTESAARRRMEPDPSRPHLAIVPVRVRNGSEEPLGVERICVRVAHLSLFESAGQMWSDEVEIVYRGSHSVSNIELTGRPPAEAPEAVLATRPRLVRVGFAARTFNAIRSLPGRLAG